MFSFNELNIYTGKYTNNLKITVAQKVLQSSSLYMCCFLLAGQ